MIPPGIMPGMTSLDITIRCADPIDLAEALIVRADEHATDAREARQLGDHSLAGRFREEQRACIKRAEVHALISQATSMQRIADALERFALSR